jgi:hypothetical protein
MWSMGRESICDLDGIYGDVDSGSLSICSPMEK